MTNLFSEQDILPFKKQTCQCSVVDNVMETLSLSDHKHMIGISLLQILVIYQPMYKMCDNLILSNNIKLLVGALFHTYAQP